jgi:hypothetical protein
MNHLCELKSVLEIIARQGQKVHLEVNFDGKRFFWGVALGSMPASQLDALLNAEPANSELRTTNSEPRTKDSHGT